MMLPLKPVIKISGYPGILYCEGKETNISGPNLFSPRLSMWDATGQVVFEVTL